ncbi:hypothetical protein PHISCL_04095 [Aspergillus sclerotialis]|uniref:Uncharacterized protein n=1 Tax=Aspergillus sclerotialis TaxID=2070753 RepID=A0A3A2ZK82_9EURO|nr:hypothetical protein PHISCL_04095 [Aspergillus sclerotialis]
MKNISVLGAVAAFCLVQTATALPRHGKVAVLPVVKFSGTPSISSSSTPSVTPSSSSIVPSGTPSHTPSLSASSTPVPQPTSSVVPWPPVITSSTTVTPRPTGIFPTGGTPGPTGTGNATPMPLPCVPTDGSEGGPPYGLPCGIENDNRVHVPVGPKFNHRRPHHFMPLVA